MTDKKDPTNAKRQQTYRDKNKKRKEILLKIMELFEEYKKL